MNGQISLMNLISMMLKRWWLIGICAVVIGGGAFMYTKVAIKPMYVSTGSLYIYTENNEAKVRSNVDLSDLMVAQELVKTYVEILSSNTFFKTVAEESGLGYDYTQLQSMVTFSPKNETEILQVSVINMNPYHACSLVETILYKAQDEVARIVNGGTVKIIDHGEVPIAPSYPSVKRNTLIGILLGLILGGIIVFTIESLDDTVKSSDDMLERYKIPVLAEIPRFDVILPDKKNKSLKST